MPSLSLQVVYIHDGEMWPGHIVDDNPYEMEAWGFDWKPYKISGVDGTDFFVFGLSEKEIKTDIFTFFQPTSSTQPVSYLTLEDFPCVMNLVDMADDLEGQNGNAPEEPPVDAGQQDEAAADDQSGQGGNANAQEELSVDAGDDLIFIEPPVDAGQSVDELVARHVMTFSQAIGCLKTFKKVEEAKTAAVGQSPGLKRSFSDIVDEETANKKIQEVVEKYHETAENKKADIKKRRVQSLKKKNDHSSFECGHYWAR